MKCGAEVPSQASYCPKCGSQAGKQGDEGELGVSEAPSGTVQPLPSSEPAAISEEGEADVELASVGRRLGALLIDGVVGNVFFWPVFIGSMLFFAVLDGSIDEEEVSDASVFSGLFLGYLASFGYLWTCNSVGASVGKLVLAIRIRRLEDGGTPGVGWGLARTITALFSALPLYLGYFWALWDDASQTWHDKAAGTVVVNAPATERKVVLTTKKPTITKRV